MEAPETKPRLLIVASGGGHWVQMGRLRPAFEGFDTAYVSVHQDYADELPGRRYYTVADMTRFNFQKIFVLAPQLIRILLIERPKVVITTGAAPGLVAIALAKILLGAKTIWIDSIANCERMSSSGMQARRFADQWLTQWPELSGADGPKYWGAVL
jgi:UDP-N-acetylglucosamine:LPS N-acetylglucosamine transferase